MEPGGNLAILVPEYRIGGRGGGGLIGSSVDWVWRRVCTGTPPTPSHFLYFLCVCVWAVVLVVHLSVCLPCPPQKTSFLMDALSYDLIRWLLLDHLQDWLVGFASCARLVGLGEVLLLWGHPCTFDGHCLQAGHSPLLVPLNAVENKGLALTLHKAKSSEVVEGKESFHSCCGRSDRRFFLWLLWQKWQVFLSLAAVAKVTGIFFLSCCGKMTGVSFPDCCGKSDRHFFTWLLWQRWQVFLSLAAVAKVSGVSVPGCCGKSDRCFSYNGEKPYFLHTINPSHAVAQTPCVYCMEKTNLF